MQIKFDIDVRKPPKHEEWINKSRGEWFTATFRYEGIGGFSFLYGVLGPTQDFCPKVMEMEDDDRL